MKQFNSLRNDPSAKVGNRKTRGGLGAGTMAAALLLAACTGNGAPTTKAGPSATAEQLTGNTNPEQVARNISDALNTNRVAQGVKVESGYQIPLGNNVGPGVLGAVNPINLGDNRYGYVDIDQGNGKVTVVVAPKGTPLQPAPFGDARFHPQEITAPVAELYSVWHLPQSETGHEPGTPSFYSVNIGDTPGNTDNLLHIDPSASQQSQNAQRVAQEDRISATRVGDIYGGK